MSDETQQQKRKKPPTHVDRDAVRRERERRCARSMLAMIGRDNAEEMDGPQLVDFALVEGMAEIRSLRERFALALKGADVEWLPCREPDAMIEAHVAAYRIRLSHDGDCWTWRLDLNRDGEGPDPMTDCAWGIVADSLSVAQRRSVDMARMLSTIVEGSTIPTIERTP